MIKMQEMGEKLLSRVIFGQWNQFIEINPLLTSQLVKYTISMSKRWSISSVKKTYVCAAISLIGEIQGLNLVPNFPHEQKYLG